MSAGHRASIIRVPTHPSGGTAPPANHARATSAAVAVSRTCRTSTSVGCPPITRFAWPGGALRRANWYMPSSESKPIVALDLSRPIRSVPRPGCSSSTTTSSAVSSSRNQLNGLVGAGRVNMAHFHADHAARLLILSGGRRARGWGPIGSHRCRASGRQRDSENEVAAGIPTRRRSARRRRFAVRCADRDLLP
jgi:hypothetical protein